MTVPDDDLRDVLAALSYYAGRRLPEHWADLAGVVDFRPGPPAGGNHGPVLVSLVEGGRAAAVLRLGRSLRERAHEAGIGLLIAGDAGWPAHGDLRGVPCLWMKGSADLNASLAVSVAIAGAAAATQNGGMIAIEFGRGLATAGVTVVTGLSIGIDAAAAAAAFDCPATPPVLVAAAGLDQAVSDNLRHLRDRAAAQSAVISPFPPGCDQTAWRSTHRDALLGALAAATVLIETSTTDHGTAAAQTARRSGRPVWAVSDTGSGDASSACRRLIADGAAQPVTGPAAVVDALPAARRAGQSGLDERPHAASRPARSASAPNDTPW